MGPRLFSRGNSFSQTTPRSAGGAASMGPRLFSRGNGQRSQNKYLNGCHASMGPRLFSRGNAIASYGAAARRACFNGAAAFQPRKR